MSVPAHMKKPPTLGIIRAYHFPRPIPLTLDHGVRGYLIPRDDLPLIHLRVTIQSGTANDPGRRVGVAYCTSQMLDEGAGQRSPIQISSDLLQIGAGFSTWAEGDSSGVAIHVLKKYLDRGLDLLIDILARPHFSPEQWTRVREELNDRALQRRAQPSPVSQLGLKAMIFGGHPYGRPILPLPSQIAKLQADHLKQFHQAHYHPRNVLIVAAGAVSADELSARLNQRLAGWIPQRGRGRVTPPHPLPGGKRSPRVALRHRPGAAQSVLAVGHRGPNRQTSAYVGLKIINTLLGGSFTSRLNQNLREKHGFTYGVHSAFEFSRESGLFAIQTSVSTADTSAALDQVFHELRLLQHTLVKPGELAKASELVLQDIPCQAETLDGLVGVFSELAAHDLELDFLNRLPENVAKLTPERLRTLARRYLQPSQAKIVVVGDGDHVASALQKKYGSLQLLDEDGQLPHR